MENKTIKRMPKKLMNELMQMQKSSHEASLILLGWLRITKNVAKRGNASKKLKLAREKCAAALESLGEEGRQGSKEDIERAIKAAKKIAAACGYPNHWSEMKVKEIFTYDKIIHEIEPHPWYKGIK